MFKKQKHNETLTYTFIQGDPNKFTPTLEQLKSIYLNKIDKVYPTFDREISEEGDWLGISYEINDHGYRSPEFDRPADVLTLGCSQTFGIGIEYITNTWPSILSDMLGLSYANLAKGGSSINSQIRRAHAYINKYGKPKYIFAVFPDFDRLEFPAVEYALKPSKSKNALKYLEVMHRKDPDEIQKVSIAPHDARDVIPPQFAHFFSAQYILMFEKYCKAAGIKLVWSTWNREDSILITKLNEIDRSAYTNFIDLEEYKWNRNTEFQIEEYTNSSIRKSGDKINCHTDFEYLPDFYIALDAKVGFMNAHIGVHHHLHWAEQMHSHAIENKWI